MDQLDGLVCLGGGVVLTATLIGALIGIPLVVVGLVILLRTYDADTFPFPPDDEGR